MNDYLIGVITAIVLALLIIAIRVAGTWLKAMLESEKESAEANNQYGKKVACDTAIKVIDTLVTATVSTIEQTTAKELRQSVKEGTVDREKLTQLAEVAFDRVLKQVTEETKQTLKDNMQDYEAFIRDRIEQAVLEVKQ